MSQRGEIAFGIDKTSMSDVDSGDEQPQAQARGTYDMHWQRFEIHKHSRNHLAFTKLANIHDFLLKRLSISLYFFSRGFLRSKSGVLQGEF